MFLSLMRVQRWVRKYFIPIEFDEEAELALGYIESAMHMAIHPKGWMAQTMIVSSTFLLSRMPR